MTDHDVLDAFRSEIQIDRIEIQRAITAGFHQLNQKFDEHAKHDAEQFQQIDSRLTTIETEAHTAGRMAWGLVVTFIGTAFAWIFSIFKHVG